MITTDHFFSSACNNDNDLCNVLMALCRASQKIYELIKDESKLTALKSINSSNDTQIKIDVLADKIFTENLAGINKIYAIASEEQKILMLTGNPAKGYGVSIDPVDGSKSAKVGIPSGSIFGIFDDVASISDFQGNKIRMSGFFIYGIHHEVFITNLENKAVSRYKEVDNNCWKLVENLTSIPSLKMMSINASNFQYWPQWIQEFYTNCFYTKDVEQAWNMRWYASLVSEVKRVLIEGGIFCYPGDTRVGYENGHLRLIYEAIPMAHLICSLGGGASDGKQPIMSIPPKSLHQKTPLFLGEKERIEELHRLQQKLGNI